MVVGAGAVQRGLRGRGGIRQASRACEVGQVWTRGAAGAGGSLSVVTAAGPVCPALFLRTVLAGAEGMAVVLLKPSAPSC